MDLFDALTAPKRRSLHTWASGELVATPWDEVVAAGHRVAAGLRRRGVEPGRPVPCILTNNAEVVSGMLGVWLAGSPVASLPVPARAMGIEEYANHLAAICARIESPLLLVEARLAAALLEPLAGRVELVEWGALPTDGRHEPSPPPPEQPAFIQYSSGSTSAPKGCVLSGAAIARQLEMIVEACAITGEDTVTSWLPLSHDMGAFGCLLSPWACDTDLLLSSPERFIRDPRTWFEDCARHAVTLTAGPPSALHVAARAQRTRPLPGRLRLRVCFVGGERIAWSALAAANAAFAPFGLRPATWMPAYGMAEATLMVTAIGIDAEPSVRYVDSVALAEERIEHRDGDGEGVAAIVCLGPARGEVELRLGDPERLSEIHVRSPSLASGYYRDPGHTAERFRDGELASGDLGFLHDGELYVVGRSDDVLSVAGRNVYAREIEAAVDLFDAVRSGCSTVIDVGADSRSRLVMLLELKDETVDYQRLAIEASRTAKRKAGVLLDECVFLPKGALPKTPSGKIQRFRCRHMLAEQELEPLERVALRPAQPSSRKQVSSASPS
jgi:fatty-acyl-CoA synthase